MINVCVYLDHVNKLIPDECILFVVDDGCAAAASSFNADQSRGPNFLGGILAKVWPTEELSILRKIDTASDIRRTRASIRA